MVILLSGASHTGKTRLAQQLMEHLHIPYLSIDHLKMGLIRSGQTTLTPTDDQQLTDYLWSIVREMVQTVIENHQNLIVEGCYIPFHWKEDFSPQSLRCIRSLFLVMSVILQCAPIDEPVYQFMDKKRSEGKPYRVYMMASANKFLRIYYASVKAYLDSLEHD